VDAPRSDDTPSRGYATYVIALILLVMLFNTVDRYIVSILLEDIKVDLELDDRQLGWILGPSFAIVYGLAVLPLARWSDRGVRRSIIAGGLFVWSLFTTATGAAQSFVQLFALRMGVGIGEAAASPASQSLISDLVPPERRGRGLSVISIGAVLGLAVGMAGGGWVSEIWGWRTAFVAAGVPGLVLALWFRVSVREPRRGASERRVAAGEGGSGWLDDCRYLLSLPSFRWLVVAHAIALFFSIGKNMWEPTFIRRVYDMGSGAAGTWYFLTSPLPSALGIFLGATLSDRWIRHDPRGRIWVPVIGQLACLPFLFAFLVWPEDHRIGLPGGLPALPVAFLWSIAGSILGAMYSAPYLSAVQELAKLRMRATAAAVFSISGSAIGSGLGPLVVGDLNERLAVTYGDQAVRWALVWLLLSLVACAVTTLLAARSFPDDLERSREDAGAMP
jgi:MFS family permease